MVRKTKPTLHKYLHLAGKGRLLRLGVAFVILVSLFIPGLTWINDVKSYALSPEVEKVIGTANPNLSAKFTYDSPNEVWQFNSKGAASQASAIAKQQGNPSSDDVSGALSQLKRQQTGGGGKDDESLYSVDLSVKASKGIVYYDNQTKLSFKMIPQFTTRDGKKVQDRIVYPFTDGGQIVYTAKSNGLKEDIVLSHYIGDSLHFNYDLDLPKTLEARLLEDGSIGIYSADPALFGSISYGSNADQAKVASARETAPKNNLVFGIPAPIIKDQNGQVANTKYDLNKNKLTVYATGLSDLHYPLSVDPSVLVTSSSDFEAGNNEGMIDFGTSGQITRGAVTGGAFGAWHFTDNSVDRGTTQNAGSGAANGMIASRHSHGTAAYNGYIYALGGDNNSGVINPGTVERAPINSDGTLGTWVSSGNLPETREEPAVMAYNGHLYLAGGYVNGATFSADVKFAAINSSDGSLGTWTSTTSMPVGRRAHGAVVYNNMMYIINGCTTAAGNCNNTSPTAIVYCASIYATGQVGTWNSTCGATGLTGRDGFAAVAYNGFIYGVGGCATYSVFACTSWPTTVQYAKINTDGTLGSWQTTATSFTGQRGLVNLTVNNGYLYLTGDQGTAYTNVMQYAPIFANGNVGNWQTSNSFTTARSNTALVTYKNYLYIVGGCSTFTAACGGTLNDVQYTPINSAGAGGSFATSGNTFAATERGGQTVAYNGKLYVMGGDNGGAPTTTIYASTIASDGTIGAFTTTGMTAFTTARTFFAAVAYNGFMYVMGGCSSAYGSCTTASNDIYTVYMSTIAADGTLGAWSAQTSIFNGRYGLGAVAYNGVMYVMGGFAGASPSGIIEYQAFGASGVLTGSWTSSAQSIPTARGMFGAQVYGDTLYIVGGCTLLFGFTTCNLSDTLHAPLTSGGDLASALVTTGNGTAFTNARGMLTLSASNGFLYLTGGRDAATYYSDTQYAPINSDGSVGTWATSAPALANNRAGHGSVTYNGYIYVAGGYDGTTYYQNVQIAPLNNGGGGATGTWVANGTTFTTARWFHSTVASSGYLYVIGGCTSWSGTCGAIASDYSRAPINADGSVGTWTQTTSALSTAVYNAASVVVNGYIYLLGGCSVGTCSTYLNTVQYAQINTSTGALGTWSSPGTGGTFNGSMPARWGAAVTAYNGYMYALGGSNGGGTLSDVWSAQINSDGTLGAWASAGTGFTTARYLPSAVTANGYLYVLGGSSAPGGTVYNDTQYIPIGGSGTITGSWTATTSFPEATAATTAAAHNGYIYLSGGSLTTSTATSKTRYAPIMANGLLGNWTVAPGYATTRLGTSGAIYNGNLYVTGGLDGTVTLRNLVDYAPLQVQSRIARYSKIVQVASAVEIAGVYYNGTLGSGSTVQYRVAPSSGIFGSVSPGTQGTGSEPTPACGSGSIYYVFVSVVMDDSQTSAFIDTAASNSNVTDVTVYYRLNASPAPNQRLFGGKWFYSELQQPLDTCKQ